MPAETPQRYCVAVRASDSQSRRTMSGVMRMRLAAVGRHDVREVGAVSDGRLDVNGMVECCGARPSVVMDSVITHRNECDGL